MSASDHPSICARCGGSRPTAGGYCPACLLAVGIESDSPEEAGGGWWEELETPEESTPPGQQVQRFGRYDLLEEIARGGMGIVFLALQRSASRLVALKTILPQELGSPALVERFRAEAEVVASLDHPAILPIYEVGEQDGIPFFSMKLAEGGSLAMRPKPLAARAATELMAVVARAVQHAHERGILHRDLKPGNILVDAAGQPFVSDFGLAKWLGRNSALTRSQVVLGTPAYLPPEQAAGESTLTTAADIYSLGVILFELLTGRVPFVADSVVEVLRQVACEPPPAPRTLDASIPRDLEIICLKCLQKAPGDRYRSAAALADDLESWLEGRPIAARPQTRGERIVRWARRNRALAALSAAVLALLLAVAIGSSVAVVRLRAARADTLEQLRSAALAEARATRLTGREGQRLDALAAVGRAARIRPGLDARDAAIAASALSDLRLGRSWPRLASADNPTVFDAPLERYATELADGSIAVCRVSDQAELLRLPGPGARVDTAFDFSPDGGYLAVKFRGGELRVWRLADQRVLLRLGANPALGLGWCAFSPQTDLVACGRRDGGVEVHRLADLAVAENPLEPAPWRHFPETSLAQGLAFDPSGRRLAICDVADGDRAPAARRVRGSVQVREVESGALVWEYPFPEGASVPSWSEDGTMLAAAGWDRNVHLLDGNTGQAVRILRGHRDATVVARFNRSGTRVVSLGFDATLRLWDAATGESLLRWPSTEIEFAFSPDDRQLATVLDRETIGLLQVTDSTTFRAWRPPTAAGRPIALGLSPDGALLVSSGFTGTRVWDARSGKSLWHEIAAAVYQQTAGFGRIDGKFHLVLGDAVGGYSLREVQSGEGALVSPPRPWWSEPDCQLRAISNDGGRAFLTRRAAPTLLVDLADTSRRLELEGRWGRGRVAFSAEGALVASGSGEESGVTVWDARTGRRLTRVDEGIDARPAFDPQGRWLVTALRTGYRFWSRSDWSAGPRIAPEQASGSLDEWTAVFSPDGTLLACAQSGDRLALYDAAQGTLLAHLDPPFPLAAQFLAFSPDGRWLFALGSDQTVQRWDVLEIRALLRGYGLDWQDISDVRSQK